MKERLEQIEKLLWMYEMKDFQTQEDKKEITNVTVFDEYIGDKLEAGKKSIAVRITIEADKTLTEEEITGKINKVLKSLSYRYNITLRA